MNTKKYEKLVNQLLDVYGTIISTKINNKDTKDDTRLVINTSRLFAGLLCGIQKHERRNYFNEVMNTLDKMEAVTRILYKKEIDKMTHKGLNQETALSMMMLYHITLLGKYL